MYRKAKLSGLLVLFIVLACMRGEGPPAAPQRNTAEQMVKKLWSADNPERMEAKESLIKLGHEAIVPLVSTLEDIIRDPRPRYPSGMEAEGEAALELFKRLPPEERSRSEYSSLEISGRLKDDCIELLGELHAVEAVPVLIELTGQEMHTDQNEHISPPMIALINIGAHAAPEVSRALDTAETRVVSRVLPTLPGLKEDDKRTLVELQTSVLQARLAIVLGEIGDPRTLYQLMNARSKLIASGRNRYALYYIEEAITKIKAKE